MTTLRKGLGIPHETTCTLIIWPRISISWYLLERNENMCSPKDLYENIHSSYIHKSPKLKATKMFNSKWMDKEIVLGLPWWLSGWKSACQCRGHGFEPRSGRIPHATGQLRPWATTAEPARLEPVLRNKRGCDSERPAHCDEEWPPLAATRESPRTETKTQHSQK